MEIYTYGDGIELILQKDPIRLLSIQQNGEYVTRKYVTYAEFYERENDFLVEDTRTGETIMYCDYSDEQAEIIKNRLRYLSENRHIVPSLLAVLNEIEASFSFFTKDFSYNWHTYGEDDRESLKGHWHAKLLRLADLRNKEEVKEKLPQIIKEEWQKYSGLKDVWASLDSEYEGHIFRIWQNIIEKAYERKEKEKEKLVPFPPQVQTVPVEKEMYSYASGVELVAIKHPHRMLYLKQKNEFVTDKILSEIPLYEVKGTPYFLENKRNGRMVFYVDYSDHALAKIRAKLNEMDEKNPQYFDVLTIVEKIERDFTDRRGLRQEWESTFSRQEQELIKRNWITEISETISFENVSEAVQGIPKIIEQGMRRYGDLNHQWERIDGDIYNEIIETWEGIVRDALTA